MPKTAAKNPADHILPLYMNGLSGRMLRLPAKNGKKRELLLVYGLHTSLERMIGLVEYVNRYGAVTMPDLPGFGGMESFYKIGEKPTLDNLADYLAAFIKLRYRNKQVTLAGFSLGLPIITRMLQKYPELVNKVDMLVSIVGFVNKDEFIFSKKRYWTYRIASGFLSFRLPAAFYKHVVLRPIFIKLIYRHLFTAKEKFVGKQQADIKKAINMEIQLWRENDPRTYMSIAHTMFTMDLTGKHVDLPVYHVAVEKDRYFNNVLVEQHMRTIFKDFIMFSTEMLTHMPSVIATPEEAAQFIPKAMRRLLAKDPGKV